MSKGLRNSFQQLFFRREMTPLLGKNYSNLLIMMGMLFTAFSVIGFAEGSLRYLEYKMKDPFINWVNVVPQAHKNIPIQRVLSELNSEHIRNEYHLQNAIGYNRLQYNFYDYNDILNWYQGAELNNERIKPFPARTMDLEDPIIPEIFSAKNILHGEVYESALDIGIIVTADKLASNNYPLNTPYVWMDLLAYRTGTESEIRVAIPVPVAAVVRSLPGLASWAATTYFHQQRSFHFHGNPFNPIDDQRLVMAYHGNDQKIAEVRSTLENILKTRSSSSGHTLNSIWTEPRTFGNNRDHHLIFVNFSPRNITLDVLDEIFREIYNHEQLRNTRANLFRLYDYENRFRSLQPVEEFDRISLNFSNLDRLRDFSTLLLENYRLEVDMAQIESRENYNFISRLTGIISLVLIGFSILSILLFISYLLKRHLESIKRNLGTFKAFGISNKELTNIYVKIVLSILAIAAVAALAFSAVFGYLGGMRVLLFLFGARIEPGIYFSLMSYYLLVALLALFGFALLVLRNISGTILNNTPGDLIYERE